MPDHAGPGRAHGQRPEPGDDADIANPFKPPRPPEVIVEGMQAFGLTMVALFLKTVATVLVQAKHRLATRRFSKPEDAAHWGGELVEDEIPIVDRAQRALRNDGENIPMFAALALAYVLLGAWPLGAWIYFPLFVIARAVHTWAYVVPTQPLRNRAYSLGQVVCLVIAGHVVVAALG